MFDSERIITYIADMRSVCSALLVLMYGDEGYCTAPTLDLRITLPSPPNPSSSTSSAVTSSGEEEFERFTSSRSLCGGAGLCRVGDQAVEHVAVEREHVKGAGETRVMIASSSSSSSCSSLAVYNV